GAGQALPRPHPGLALSRGLPHPADLQGGAARAGDPQPHGGGARARGVLQGGMGAGPGGDQPPLRPRAGDGGPPRALQARGEGDRLVAGLLGHLHGEVRHGGGGLVLSRALLRLGPARQEEPLRGAGLPRGHPALPAVARRPDGHGARAGVLLRAHRQRLQALPGGQLRADAHRVRLGQPHLRLPALRGGGGLPGGEPPPRRRRQPVPRLRGDHRRRDSRHPEEAQAAQALRGQCVRGRHARPGSEDAARGAGRAGALPRGARGLQREGGGALPPPRPARAAGLRPGGDRLGADPPLRAHLIARRSHAMAGRLQGKVALITGAGMGMGREAALLFAEEGARVVVCDIDRVAAEETVSLVKRAGGDAAAAIGDVAVEDDVRRMTEEGVRRLGALHILYNNAGVLWKDRDRSVLETDGAQGDRVRAINLKSVVWVTKYGVPHVRAAGGGSIILVGSVSALAGFTRAQDAYTAAKGGLIALNKSLAIQFARDNIRCNIIHPGIVETPLQAPYLTDEVRAEFRTAIPLGRIGRPREIAYAALFLASEESSFMTGAEMIVDGGFMAQ